MAEQLSVMKEFRLLDEKLRTIGLTKAEKARWAELRDLVAPEAEPLKPGFDVNAAAAELQAALEPAGLRRPAEPLAPGETEEDILDLDAEPAGSWLDPPVSETPSDLSAVASTAGALDDALPIDAQRHAVDAVATDDPAAPDAAFEEVTEEVNPQAWDASAQGWDASVPAADPNAQPWDPNTPAWDPDAQPSDPNTQAWDPNTQAWDPNTQPWDPNTQPWDPNTPAWDPSAQPWDPNTQAWDPNAQPWDPNAPAADPSAQSWDPNAPAWNADAVPSFEPSAPGNGPPAPATEPPGEATDSSGLEETLAGNATTPETRVPAPSDLGMEEGTSGLPEPDPAAAWPVERASEQLSDGREEDPLAGGWLSGSPAQVADLDYSLIGEAPLEPSSGLSEPIQPSFSGSFDLGKPEPAHAEKPLGPAPLPPLADWANEVSVFEGGLAPAAPGGTARFDLASSGSFKGSLPSVDVPVDDDLQPPPSPRAEAVQEPAGVAEAPVEPAAPPSVPVVERAGAAHEPLLPRPESDPESDVVDLSEISLEEIQPEQILDASDVLEVGEQVPVPSPTVTTGKEEQYGGPSPTFIAGAHRVVVHTVEGQVKRGTLSDTDLDGAQITLEGNSPAESEAIPTSRIKAIFFMLPPGETPATPTGHKVRVTFKDGRQVAGFSEDCGPERMGFFMVPADTRTSTARIWVYRDAVRQLSVT